MVIEYANVATFDPLTLMSCRYERQGGLGGLVGAAHLSLLKTLETGGRQW